MDDTISRQDAASRFSDLLMLELKGKRLPTWDEVYNAMQDLPSVQPQIVWCRECVYYDPPHIQNGTRRYEYKDMPSDAFDKLGTGLVHSGYGVNVGGRCLRSKTRLARGKSIFMNEDDYCSRGERRADDDEK